jgi:ribosomal protein L16/L10AE
MLKNIKLTKKDKYKKISENSLKRIFLKKDDFFKKNINNFSEHNKKYKIILKKYKKNFKSFIYLNMPFTIFTKKSIGSRMGKGKGNFSG